jgi:hypothetical protein
MFGQGGVHEGVGKRPVDDAGGVSDIGQTAEQVG